MKKLISWALLAAPFIALFIIAAALAGLWVAVSIFASLFVVVLSIFAGVKLLEK